MSENTEITAQAGEEAVVTEAEFKAPTSQEELDRIINTAVARTHKKYGDYDELRAQAAKLSEIEEANKTEAEKQAERLAAAEAKAAELESRALRSEVAANKGVPLSLLTGSSREELEASADALIEFRGEQKPSAPSSSALGRVNTSGPRSVSDEFAAWADANTSHNL